MVHPFSQLDYQAVKHLTSFVFAHPWAELVTYLAAQIAILVYPAVLYILWRKPEVHSHQHAARKAVVLAIFGVVLVAAIKGLVGMFFLRDRPFVTHPDIMFMSFNIDPPSFPSGHELISMVIAASLYLSGFRKLGGWLILLAVLVGIGRIAAGVHYPTDVLGGAVIAWLVAWYLHREASTLKAYLPNN